MENKFSMKELYDVLLKATYRIEINGKVFEPGEVIAHFDSIQIANFHEMKSINIARGGFDNRAHVVWDDAREIQLAFSEGIFNKTQFALLVNSKALFKGQNDTILLTKREFLETDEDGIIELSNSPMQNLFFYDEKTGEKVVDYDEIDNTHYNFKNAYYSVLASYEYNYTNKATVVKIGNQLTAGFLSLEGKSRLQEDISGKMSTVVIKIPKLRLISDLSMKLGGSANPVVANFGAMAYPIGDKGNREIMSVFFLDDDIDDNDDI